MKRTGTSTARFLVRDKRAQAILGGLGKVQWDICGRKLRPKSRRPLAPLRPRLFTFKPLLAKRLVHTEDYSHSYKL
jgi:hypothetical protein